VSRKLSPFSFARLAEWLLYETLEDAWSIR
jgi:hypothetical protein